VPGQPAEKKASLLCRSLRVCSIAPTSLAAPCVALGMSLHRWRWQEPSCLPGTESGPGITFGWAGSCCWDRKDLACAGPSSKTGDRAATPSSAACRDGGAASPSCSGFVTPWHRALVRESPPALHFHRRL